MASSDFSDGVTGIVYDAHIGATSYHEIQDVAKNFIEVDKKVLKATLARGGFGEWPPYTTACSSDLTEYASSQEIPNFGIQAYFAISRDPLQQWDHFERAVFPIGENTKTSQPESSMVGSMSPDISCFVSPDHGEPNLSASSPRPKPRIPAGGPKTPPKGLNDVSPRTPKDPCSIKGSNEFNMDPRIPPIWGSNLVNVKNSSSQTRQSPIKKVDNEVSEHDMLDFFNDDIGLFEADLDKAQNNSPPKVYPTISVSPASTPSPAETPTGQGAFPQIDIDELYDAMSKCVDEDMRVIDARIPATTPQRSPSPKRPSTFTSPEPEQCPGQSCPARQTPSSRPSSKKTSQGQGAYPQMGIDDLFDAVSKYVDKDMQDIDARIPSSTPQRCPSPRKSAGCAPSPMQTGAMTRNPPQPRPIIRPSPDQLYGALEQVAAGSGQSCPIQPSCPGKPAPPSGPSPKKPTLSPDNLFKALEHVSSDKNIQDFYNTSLNIPDDDQFTSPASSPCADYGGKEKQVSPIKDVATTVQEILEEMNRPATGVLKTTGDFIQDTLMNKSGEDLEDSFGVDDRNDYCWDSSEGWTDEPDENFSYFLPSPRVYETPEPDPYAAQRGRWADVERSPPAFNRDPKIRDDFASPCQNTNDEFDMESFEEPIWTSAEQYFKYKKASSPFIGSRQTDRRTLDPSQFPKYVDEDMQVIDARIPATTPQRSPSPRRPSPGPSAKPPMQCPMVRSLPPSRHITHQSPEQLYDSLQEAADDWCTDGPDESFAYCPASSLAYGSPEPDPYASETERWVDEEPIWTSAEQYFKYRRDN